MVWGSWWSSYPSLWSPWCTFSTVSKRYFSSTWVNYFIKVSDRESGCLPYKSKWLNFKVIRTFSLQPQIWVVSVYYRSPYERLTHKVYIKPSFLNTAKFHLSKISLTLQCKENVLVVVPGARWGYTVPGRILHLRMLSIQPRDKNSEWNMLLQIENMLGWGRCQSTTSILQRQK